MSRQRMKGIFCLEGDWWNDLNRSSTVKPGLELLCQADKNVTFVHRDVGTVAELYHYLDKWSQRGRSNFPILYLAFHGDSEGLRVGDGRRRDGKVTLDTLAERLSGRCNGKLIHFGACGTLDLDERHIQRFLRTTGATAATGFRSDIFWLKSTVFEVLLFEVALRGAFTRTGARGISSRIKGELAGLAGELGFRMIIRK